MKKYLISILIGSLIVTGLLGVSALLIGTFDEIQFRILLTTLAFTIYSILGLCCNSVIGGNSASVGKAGLVVIAFSVLHALVTTWFTPDNVGFLQLRFSLLFISIFFAHSSLMLLINKSSSMVSTAIVVSITCSALATIIAFFMLSSLSATPESFKLLGVISIVGVISTIIAPLLSFTANKKS